MPLAWKVLKRSPVLPSAGGRSNNCLRRNTHCTTPSNIQSKIYARSADFVMNMAMKKHFIFNEFIFQMSDSEQG